MSAYSKSNDPTSSATMINALVVNTRKSLPDDIDIESPILSSYNRTELVARDALLQKIAQLQKSEIAALERKALADALADQFELTGSDLPADANPRQLHLF